ncbi:MAG: 30S ribosomal protein S12 methylthiotransferase RimO [Bacteroidota bacterium]
MKTKVDTRVAQEPKTVAIITLGCSKNTVDSEILAGHLKGSNFVQTTNAEEADAVVINTCGFIDAAKEESINTIIEAGNLKKSGKLKTLIVAGCLSARYGDELKEGLPEVDHFFGTEDYGNILKALSEDLKYNLLGEHKKVQRILSTPNHYAYLKISEGCDNPCSFCAIPIMRGGHISKPKEELIEEVELLVAQGIKEIVVVGQDTTFYGLDTAERRRSLGDLLRAISDVPGVEWIRLMYAYPAKFPREILDVIAERDNICKYIDMPMQHISTNVLKSMRRGITRRTLEELVAHIRERVPGITMRTTFIVGYPSETEADFEELCDFVRQIRLDRIGVFTYSQEDDTYADILGDPIPQDVKEDRKIRLMEIQRQISYEKNQEKIGKQIKVLIEEDHNGEYQGRSESDAPEVDNEIFVQTSIPLKPGDFVIAEIDDASEFDLFGRFVRMA